MTMRSDDQQMDEHRYERSGDRVGLVAAAIMIGAPTAADARGRKLHADHRCPLRRTRARTMSRHHATRSNPSLCDFEVNGGAVFMRRHPGADALPRRRPLRSGRSRRPVRHPRNADRTFVGCGRGTVRWTVRGVINDTSAEGYDPATGTVPMQNEADIDPGTRYRRATRDHRTLPQRRPPQPRHVCELRRLARRRDVPRHVTAQPARNGGSAPCHRARRARVNLREVGVRRFLRAVQRRVRRHGVVLVHEQKEPIALMTLTGPRRSWGSRGPRLAGWWSAAAWSQRDPPTVGSGLRNDRCSEQSPSGPARCQNDPPCECDCRPPEKGGGCVQYSWHRCWA